MYVMFVYVCLYVCVFCFDLDRFLNVCACLCVFVCVFCFDLDRFLNVCACLYVYFALI